MTTQNTTTNRIAELAEGLKSANTATMDGRQVVINACKELYNLIEEDVYMAGKEWMLKGMYQDLCNGNFAEPFMCEQKKTTFQTIATIYNEQVVPNLQ
jgi:hypothetical protein